MASSGITYLAVRGQYRREISLFASGTPLCDPRYTLARGFRDLIPPRYARPGLLGRSFWRREKV